MPAPGSSEKSDRRRQAVLEAAVACFARKGLTARIAAGTAATPRTPEAALQAAQSAYQALIQDREILRFLMHANCAADEPLVGEAVRCCYAKQVELVRQLVGSDEAVRRWFGAGMLENVTVTLRLAEVDEPWAHVLSGR